MTTKARRERQILRLRATGWTGFLSTLAAVAAICVALFFWAEGSAMGVIIAAAAAVVFLSVTATAIIVNNKTGDPVLGKRMARLRRARYRSTYPPDGDR